MTSERERLVSLLRELASTEGVTQSPLNAVRVMMAREPRACAPVVYEPSIVIIGQGRKRGYLGDRVYTYDANNYLVLSVPLPFECETEATPEEPLLGLSVRVDPGMLGELLMEMDEEVVLSGELPRGIYATPLTRELTGAAVRLLECLRSPVESRILGPQIVREITYRVLRGEQGGALRAVAARNGRFSRIARVLRRIHTEFESEFDVESMAKEVNMSVSAFHHNFKAVTSVSPLQYLKSIRLHKARLLMVQEGLNVGIAADRVGYESASQFSREYKRLFGSSPAEEAARLRAGAHA